MCLCCGDVGMFCGDGQVVRVAIEFNVGGTGREVV